MSSWGATSGLDCLRHYNRSPTLFEYLPFSLLAPANVSNLRLSSMIYCMKLPFEVTGSALWWLAYCMRLSRFSICGKHTRAWSQLKRTHVWQNTDDDRPVSGVGPHLPVDVFFGLHPEQLKPYPSRNFFKYVAYLPNYYQNEWNRDSLQTEVLNANLTAQSWQVGEIAPVSPYNYVRILCGQVPRDLLSSGVFRGHVVQQQHGGTHSCCGSPSMD